MSNTNNRVIAGITVAAVGLTLAGTATALAGPSPEQARAGVLTKAEKKAVTKIARKVANQQVRRLAPSLNVNSAKTAGTATTAQTATHAASADMATNAQNAANAGKVGGLDVLKVNTVIASGGAPVALVSRDGFTLTASCAAGDVDLVAASSVPGGRLRTAAIDNNETVATQGSNNLSASGFSVTVPGGLSLGSMTLEFVAANGTVINAWIGYRDDAPGCAFFGNYMVG